MTTKTSKIKRAKKTDTDKVLDRLERDVRQAKGFMLGFVLCNLASQQDILRDALKARLRDKHLLEIVLDKPISSLSNIIKSHWNPGNPPEAICVYGLEISLKDIVEASTILESLNNEHEILCKELLTPVLLWLPTFALDLIARRSPDFWALGSITYIFDSTYIWLNDIDTLLKKEGSGYSETVSSVARHFNSEFRIRADYFEIGSDEPVSIKIEDEGSTENHSMSAKEFLAVVALHPYLQGRMLIEQGSWQEGKEKLQEALSGFRQFDNPYGKAITFLALGDVHQRFGDYEIARMFYSDAERHFRQIGDKVGEAMAWLRAGTVELQMQDIAAAKAHIQAASDYFHAVGDADRAKLSDEWLALVQRVEQGASEEIAA